MLGKSFQRNKVNRLISVSGEEFDFKRNKKNEFEEPIKSEFDIIKIKGFFHQVNSQVTQVGTDANVTRTKPQPAILCLLEDGEKIKKNDILEYKGKTYTVVESANQSELDICYDISLEVIQDG